MTHPRAAWSSATLPVRFGVVALALILVGGGATAAAAALGAFSPPPAAALATTPPAPVTPSPSPSPSPTSRRSPSPTPSPRPTSSPSPTQDPGRPDSVTGMDGRLTLLLLGSDYRPAHPGNRTDTIMVVSIVPGTGAVSALSIPRDTARFPLPGGGVYGPKINGLYQHYLARLGSQGKAAAAMKRTIGAALGVEIDSYVVTGFQGVRRLIDAVGGVDVTLSRAVRDPYYWVDSRTQGVYFPAGVNHLNGKRALIFARTRKGDNDFERARRQQMLVAAGVEAVRKRGIARLPQLLVTAARFVKTDLPLVEAPRLFQIVSGANLRKTRRVVLSPSRYATGIAGTYSYQLRLGVVRDLVAEWFAPVPGSPAAPIPVAKPPAAMATPVHPAPEAGP